jgi:hypothetical protein
MKDLSRVRMITANFSMLQGLKMVPLGLLLVVVTLWANTLHGPARDFTFPGGCMVSAFFLYLLISRYYSRTYGTVQPTLAYRQSEWVRGLVGGIAGLVCFLIDVNLKPPVSMIGLLFAGTMIAEYIRLTWKMKSIPFLFYSYLVAALVLALLSLLPAIGVVWWKAAGIRSLLLGVTTTAGLLFVIAGILGHFSLVQWLGPAEETNHEQRI